MKENTMNMNFNFKIKVNFILKLQRITFFKLFVKTIKIILIHLDIISLFFKRS